MQAEERTPVQFRLAGVLQQGSEPSLGALVLRPADRKRPGRVLNIHWDAPRRLVPVYRGQAVSDTALHDLQLVPPIAVRLEAPEALDQARGLGETVLADRQLCEVKQWWSEAAVVLHRFFEESLGERVERLSNPGQQMVVDFAHRHMPFCRPRIFNNGLP